MVRVLVFYFALAASVMVASVASHAGQCRLEVQGRSYLHGPCLIATERDGSFSIGIGDRGQSRHFAVVVFNHLFPGVAFGYWNGPQAEVFAHYPLGHLFRRDDCWSNHRAMVCAQP